jgi:hypothetical protein
MQYGSTNQLLEGAMDWWTDFTHWLGEPVSNATVIVVAVMFGYLVTKLGLVIEGRLIELGKQLPRQ